MILDAQDDTANPRVNLSRYLDPICSALSTSKKVILDCLFHVAKDSIGKPFREF